MINGGRSVIYNHQWAVPEQRHALDLVAVEGDTRRGPGSGPESYLAYGDPLTSPVNGVVAHAVDNPYGVAGTHLSIDMGDGRYVMLAHLQAGSLAVTEGDPVAVGDFLGRVGNTGLSSEPHLHVQVQDAATLADSARTWPIVFEGVVHSRGGRCAETDRADLRRDDRIRRT